MLFDAGLAGICMPREYGGQGLTPAHQRVLNEELNGYEYPSRLQAPTFTPCAAVLLDFGTAEQKKRAKIGRAHVGTPGTHAQPVCPLLLATKIQITHK